MTYFATMSALRENSLCAGLKQKIRWADSGRVPSNALSVLPELVHVTGFRPRSRMRTRGRRQRVASLRLTHRPNWEAL